MATNIAELRAGATQTADPFQDLLRRPAFSAEAWHVMNERDNALVRDQVLHGTASRDFIYEFEIKGTKVDGVSVIGARELASQYGGIKARIVATIEKKGSLFIFRTFAPLTIETRVLRELEADDDFYECVMEVQDIKVGNSIEVRKKENRSERRRDGSTFDRPHYDVICESKAFRNGVLSVLPQSVVTAFLERCKKAGQTSKEKTLDELRELVAGFCAKSALSIDRRFLGSLSFAEISGLGEAAREGKAAFVAAAKAVGLVAEDDKPAPEQKPDPKPAAAAPKGNPDPETGEIPPETTPAAAMPVDAEPAQEQTRRRRERPAQSNLTME